MDVHSTKNIRILTVTDNDALANLIGQHPSMQMATFLRASESSEAMRIFARERPRIILVDFATCGNELIETLVERDPAAEVLLINGHNSVNLAVESIQKGACDYLP